MSNEQQIAYLLSIIENLNASIDKVMDHLPYELAREKTDIFGNRVTTYPVLDPILEFKESLYEQLEALRGDHKS